MLGQMAEGYGSPGLRLFDEGSETHNKMDPSPTTEGIPLPPEPPRDSQTGGVFGNPGDTKGRDCKGSPRRVCGLTKERPVLDASRAIGRMSPGQSRPQCGCGVSWNGGPTRISGEPPSESRHQNVGNVGPKVTTRRGVIWPRDSLLLGGRGREPRERAKGERERERERERFKYPSVGLSMI
jgi:hypothetical protein